MLLLNTSLKLHFKIAVFVAAWLVVLLVLIAPFDASDLSFEIRLQILPPYGLISLAGYMAIVPIQNWLFAKTQKWNLGQEVGILLLFNLLALFGSFLYYKTAIINGTYDFYKFTFEVYYPIFFLLLPIIIFGRWFLTKQARTPKKDEILLSGENKYDLLKIKFSDLIAVSSADNYVEVTYLTNARIKKKLLRNTLKNIAMEIPDLVRVHRSHMINPAHFKEWKNGTTIILLDDFEVPVSKNYKQALLQFENSSLKAAASSLS